MNPAKEIVASDAVRGRQVCGIADVAVTLATAQLAMTTETMIKTTTPFFTEYGFR